MLNRLPRHMPSLRTMLEDIGSPTTKELARALRVSETTARRWKREGKAPQVAMLAIFWVTTWGMSAADTEAHNSAVMSAALARARLDRIGELEGRLQRLGRIAEFGSANDPAPGVAPVMTMLNRVPTDSENQGQPANETGTTDATEASSTEQPCGLQEG